MSLWDNRWWDTAFVLLVFLEIFSGMVMVFVILDINPLIHWRVRKEIEQDLEELFK